MTIPVSISVYGSKDVGPWRQLYRFFGCDEINYVYMKNGEKLLSKLGSLGPHQTFFRAHNQFVTGEGIHALKWGSTNAYTEDEKGNPVYDWAILDRIYDTYLATKVKPYVQFGFMPQALSTHPEPYQHKWTPTAPYHEIFTGWAYPPKDYAKWGELIYQWTKHCLERYGVTECESWYWETWNEPDMEYWMGTPGEFYALNDHAVAAVRRALPTARVGGPETTGGGPAFLRDFLQHCVDGENMATGEKGCNLDFTSFHAKGKPQYVEKGSHVRMDVSNQLREIDASLQVIASFPQFKDKPIVIGESDPEGAAAAQGPQLMYRNGTLYSSYTAASFARKHDLADKHGSNLQGAITWAFEFEDQPYFAGFRVLASNDVDLPVLNIFRMFAEMNGTRVDVQSSQQVPLEKILKESVREDPDVGAIASRDGSRLCIMVWHYHDDELPGPAAAVELQVQDFEWDQGPNSGKLTHYRVDNNHSNSYSEWLKMGSPQDPSKEQYAQLQAAVKLATYKGETRVRKSGKHPTFVFELPRQGVSLLVLENEN
jgi:xylan 1,4-beta-xylosidase